MFTGLLHTNSGRQGGRGGFDDQGIEGGVADDSVGGKRKKGV